MKVRFTQDYEVKGSKPVYYTRGQELTCNQNSANHFLTRGVAVLVTEETIDVTTLSSTSRQFVAGKQEDVEAKKPIAPKLSSVSQPAQVSQKKTARKPAN